MIIVPHHRRCCLLQCAAQPAMHAATDGLDPVAQAAQGHPLARPDQGRVLHVLRVQPVHHTARGLEGSLPEGPLGDDDLGEGLGARRSGDCGGAAGEMWMQMQMWMHMWARCGEVAIGPA